MGPLRVPLHLEPEHLDRLVGVGYTGFVIACPVYLFLDGVYPFQVREQETPLPRMGE